MISIKEKIGTPKYKQIISSIEEAITSGVLKKGDQIPSINSIKNKHSLSRDTVLMAFNELKSRGIIKSIVGKGYYVSNEDVNVTQRIFLLFDELNSFKEDLYNSFLSNLTGSTQVDIFFHHFNHEVFSKLIYDNVGSYNHYIIMPANLKETHLVIENLPADRVYILDQTHEELSQYSGIFQNFEKDIYNSLTNGLHLIKKYKKLVLVFNGEKQPQGMLNGFNLFVDHNNFRSEVIHSVNDRVPGTGEIYIIPDDKSLLKVIKGVKTEHLELSKDIGIISYNDTLLKEIVEGGITTISTDFTEMGAHLANMIMKKQQIKIENPNSIIIRNSL